MKPFRAFLFLLCVLSILFLVSFYREKRDQDYFHAQNTPLPELPVETEIPEDSTYFQDTDSVEIVSDPLAETDSIVQSLDTIPVEMPQLGDKSFIYSPYDSIRLVQFVQAVQEIGTDKKQVRILYFGDSQIEGDLITAAMRKALQQEFGGKGPGLIAPEEYYNTEHQLIMTMSDNWEHLDVNDSPENKSLLFKNSLAKSGQQEEWFRINRLKFLEVQEDYEQIRIFAYANDSINLDAYQSAVPYYQEQLSASKDIQTIEIPVSPTPEDLKLSFTANDSLLLTAFSLESPSGIFVDNIALRGRSYPPFNKADKKAFETTIAQISPQLFILQFGVNVVPYSSQDYHVFKRQMNRQIGILKHIYPDVPILLVGVSDMAERVDGDFVPYKSIQKIKQIQFDLAMENGCIFWDLEQFMGGPGSMQKWVNAEPPLARKDYIHFSKSGGDLIGKELARLLINEVENSRQLAWKNN